jgi:hypothetical protein
MKGLTPDNPEQLPEVVITDKKITDKQIRQIAQNGAIEYAALKSFIEVESGGTGFGKDGRLLIQFEPHYFKRKEPFAPSGAWSINKVDVQSKEWIAFNNAFAIDKDSAMESTSIGLPQIMGEHWKRLGYHSVSEMWQDFEKSEYNQVAALVRFINSDNRLMAALKSKNWDKVATIYNGAKYKEMAKKWGRESYDISLAKAYKKYS